MTARLSRGHLEHRGGTWWACVHCGTFVAARACGDEPDAGCGCRAKVVRESKGKP